MQHPFFTALLCVALSGCAVQSGEISPHVYATGATIPLKGTQGWDMLTFDPSSQRLFVTRHDHVDVVDVPSQKVVGQIRGLSGVHGVALVPNLHLGFVTNSGDGTVRVFDLTTLRETNRIQVGSEPDEIIYDRSSDQLFVFNGDSEDVSVVDPKKQTVTRTIELGGAPEFAVTEGREGIFVNLENKNQVLKIDPLVDRVHSRWSLGSGEEPTGIAYDSKRHRVMSACANNLVTALNSGSGAFVGSIAIGNGPDGLFFDSERDLLFVPNGKDGTMTVAKAGDVVPFTVVDTVLTGEGARTIAGDSKTGTVFVVSGHRMHDPANPEARSYEEGSVKVLLLRPGK